MFIRFDSRKEMAIWIVGFTLFFIPIWLDDYIDPKGDWLMIPTMVGAMSWLVFGVHLIRLFYYLKKLLDK